MTTPLTHQNPIYGWLMIVGIVASLLCWLRLSKDDYRLMYIYIAALSSALIGAKVSYILSEGFLYFVHPQSLMILLTGKSITGALVFGFLGVELTKRVLKYNRPTGDLFAIVVPLGIMFGRVGCLLHGCCQGTKGSYPLFSYLGLNPERWPAPQLEFGFNLFALIVALLLGKYKILPNQHFHLYLMAYGTFRLWHEVYRDTPKVFDGLSGYQLTSLIMIAAGLTGFIVRQRKNTHEPSVLPKGP